MAISTTFLSLSQGPKNVPLCVLLLGICLVMYATICDGASTVGMVCADGTVLTGDTGPEKFLTPNMICDFFPKYPMGYPSLGYKEKHLGSSTPDPATQLAGPAGPLSVEAVHARCPTMNATMEIIRDIACVVKKYPNEFGAFMNRVDPIATKLEVAAFFAHVGQETADLNTIWENWGKAGQYCDYGTDYMKSFCNSDRLFYGRGVHQLTHPVNYHDYSVFWFNDGDVLLEDPTKLLYDMELAWGSAIWFWFAVRDHTNGSNCLRSTSVQKTLLEGQGFGNTISVINGGIECAGPNTGNKLAPFQRISRVVFFMDMLEMPMWDGYKENSVNVLPKWFTEGCPFLDGGTQLDMQRITDWRVLENYSGKCDGWAAPYPCGWGGVTSLPLQPLVSFKGQIKSDSNTCLTESEPIGGFGTWPWNLITGSTDPDGNISPK